MPKFILIDHSLKGIGGHHYEYASHILRAAEKAGFQVVLATHRKFRSAGGFADRWQILPIFRYTTYSNYTIYSCSSSRSALRDTPGRNTNDRNTNDRDTDRNVEKSSPGPVRLVQRLKEHLFRSGRQRRIASFARSLAEVISQVALDEGDQVFIPTLSELDLTGLSDLLSREPSSRLAQWHLQFHYSFFEGREPDYPRQTRQLEATREIFREALRRVASHRLHFYNTTRQLATQYNQLGVATFHALPYPVNPAFHETSAKRSAGDVNQSGQAPGGRRQSTRKSLTCSKPVPLDSRPLRVTCVGAIRKEKGYDQLNRLLHELWDDHFAISRTQLVVQSNKRKFVLPLPAGALAADTAAASDEQSTSVEYVPHPLGMEQYVDLIRRADIGLLLYDSERYYVRCSGVLVEMLSVGVPVIATAGCWMAEQLAEPIFRHIDQLAESLPEISRHALGEVVIPDRESASHDTPAEPWLRRSPVENLPLVAEVARLRPGKPISGEIGYGNLSSAGCLNVPAGCTDLIVRWQWKSPAEQGTYVGLTVHQFDARGNRLSASPAITGQRRGDQPATSLFHLDAEAVGVRLAWRNAYHTGPIRLDGVSLHFMSAVGMPGGSCPAGAVGLIAADASQVGSLLRDLVKHWAHYRATAQQFSRSWAKYHNPNRIVTELLRQAGCERGCGDGQRAA